MIGQPPAESETRFLNTSAVRTQPPRRMHGPTAQQPARDREADQMELGRLSSAVARAIWRLVLPAVYFAPIHPTIKRRRLNKQTFPLSTGVAVSSAIDREQEAVATPRVPRKVLSSRTKLQAASIVPPASIVSNGTLRIAIEHDFTEAHASVSIDNSLVYEHLLHGDTRRRGLIFRKVEGSNWMR